MCEGDGKIGKQRYWSKILIEVDDETGKFRIVQGFHQPVAGAGYKTKKKKVDLVQESTPEVVHR